MSHSTYKELLRGGLREGKRGLNTCGLRELYRGTENGISQQALEGPAEHLNEIEGRSSRGGSGEGEWPSFWVQFVSFHPACPALALTDVQRGSGAGPLIHMGP